LIILLLQIYLGVKLALSRIKHCRAKMTVLAARMIQDWEITHVDPMDANEWKQKLTLKADPYPAMKLVPSG
jgi:hypothetical protein